MSSGEGTRYVEVPADRMMGLLRDIGEKVRSRSGSMTESVQGREVVVDLQPGDCGTIVRVYTSLARGADAVRGCGEDAVRIVIGCEVQGRDGKSRFLKLAGGPRIYRTAPTQLPQEERVDVFLARFRDALRNAYQDAREWTRCPVCDAPMSERENKATKSKFWGCTRFPECRGTRAHQSS